MSASVLLTGATGTLGGHALPLLLAAGGAVRVLSRRPGEPREGVEHLVGDLTEGTGIADAVRGVDVIVHCAGNAKGDERMTRNLVDAARAEGRPHLVYISVVGADRIPVRSGVDRAMFGYFAAKYAAERVLAESGLPWTTLRATQFHELTFTTARALAKLPVVPIPGVRFQPVDGAEVARRLVDLALGAPAGLVPEFAGPTVYGMDELVRSYLRANGKHRVFLPMPVFGAAGNAVRAGANLGVDADLGHRSWTDFLAERVPQPR